MKLNIVLLLAIAVCKVIANCEEGRLHTCTNSKLAQKIKLISLTYSFPTEYLYSCKAKDDEGQNVSYSCIELRRNEKYNCTCFIDDQSTTPEVHYLDCLDALRKGQKKSGVYSLKPDNSSPFKVQYCLDASSLYIV